MGIRVRETKTAIQPRLTPKQVIQAERLLHVPSVSEPRFKDSFRQHLEHGYFFSALRTDVNVCAKPENHVAAEVKRRCGESLENALRRFKRKVQAEDIIKEVKRHSY